MQLGILLAIVMNYIGISMNRLLYIPICFIFLYAQPNMYWDLGVAVSSEAHKFNISNSIHLSTYHRLEGLKKYYIYDFYGALFHFEELNSSNKNLVLYELIDSYYSVGNYEQALIIFNDSDFLSDNLLYLKSQIFIAIGDYDSAFSVLQLLKNNFPGSDYLEIIKFDLEKINLLK